MRITAEATHDDCMFLSPLERCGVVTVMLELREQCDRSLLHRHGFGMLEWHVQEPALASIELVVDAGIDDGNCRKKRFAITGESARRVAERVTGELVEQQHMGERGVGINTPIVQRPAQCGFDGIAEPFADRCIEGRILAKPFTAFGMRVRAEPEFEDVSGKGWYVVC